MSPSFFIGCNITWRYKMNYGVLLKEINEDPLGVGYTSMNAYQIRRDSFTVYQCWGNGLRLCPGTHFFVVTTYTIDQINIQTSHRILVNYGQ